MDDQERLLKATYKGDTAALHQLVQDNPLLLLDTATINSHQNILNTAIKSEHPHISLQIARYSPYLLTVQDRDGVRPLDVASAYGSLQIVRELLILAPNPVEICQLTGKDGKSAIHHACINGRVDVIQELTKACPDSIPDVTFFGETVIHLAVKYYRFEALKSLLQWLETSGMASEVLSRKDKDDNTVLHHAAMRKQLETVELLLDKNSSFRNSIDANAVNSKGLTAMEIIDIYMETSSDLRLKKLLEEAQGSTSSTSSTTTRCSLHHHHHHHLTQIDRPKTFGEMVKFCKFNWERDSASELRNALLVVAALFASIAAQGIFNPSSQLLSDTTSIANKAIYFAANWCLLLSALRVMDYLNKDMPFRREFMAAGLSLGIACGVSIGTIKMSYQGRCAVLIIPILLVYSLRVISRLCGR